MTIPVKVEVYDKAFRQVGTIGDAKFVTVIPRWPLPGTATISVRSNHPQTDNLVAPGARLRFLDDKGRHLMSGRITNLRGSGPEFAGFNEFDIIDDLDLLRYIVGWVVPTNPITGQGTAGTNWTLDGPAETVLKAAVTQNGVNRLGLPIIVPADLGRGNAVKGRLRMQSIYERLFPTVDGAGIENAGIIVEMRMIPDVGIRLEVSTPSVRAQPLTELGGIVTSWKFSSSAPTATRGVAAGQGEGTLRLFREKSLPALEAEVGWKYEISRDARDTNDPTTMYARLDESFAEGAAKAGVEIELSETRNFRYGEALRVGDIVNIIVGGRTFVEPLNEVTLSWTADGGFVTRPRVGTISSEADTGIIKAIGAIARAIRNRNAGQ